eukprot:397466_1
MHAMQSFVRSIEPLFKTNLSDDAMIHHSEATAFLNQIETLYHEVNLKAKKEEKSVVDVSKVKKDAFVEEMNRLLRDKPILQSFVDNVQVIIDKNRHKLYKPQMYSLSKRFEPRYVGNQMEFSNWNEFEMNVSSGSSSNEFEPNKPLYLTDDVESLFDSAEMIGE